MARKIKPHRILPDGTVEITLTRGQTTIIDSVDADLAKLNWCALKSKHGFYAVRKIYNNGKPGLLPLHRVILERVLGRSVEANEDCDHINLAKLDNRRENLRVASRSENQQNRGLRSDNTSGYKGVWEDRGKWCAKIRVRGTRIHLGTFETPEEAHEAYCEAAEEYFGDFARFE